MKIIIKDKKKEYNIEVDSSKNIIKDIKLEIQKKFRLELNKIKLLYNGKFLSDNNTLESYKIKEDSKIIFLGYIEGNNITTKKEAEKEKSNSILNIEKKQNYASQISNLINLGYEKEKAEKAIEQTEGDINKAIDILIKEKKDNKNNNNKIINNIEKPNEEINLIKELNNEINIPKELKSYGIYMKILTCKDENIMNIILNNIKENNPALLNQLIYYEKEFVKYLSTPITREDLDFYLDNYQTARSLLGAHKKEENGKFDIILTRSESEIINNLKKIGNFTIEEIIEAYLLNHKNENKAANFLMDKKKNNINLDNNIEKK